MRRSISFTLLGVLIILQSACLTTKTRSRKDPVFEVRRIQIGIDHVTKTERVKIGENSETHVERIPVLGPGSDIPDASEVTIYDERTITTTVPVYENRVTSTSVPRYKWQREQVGVRTSKYQTVHTSWSTLPYIALSVPVLLVEGIFYIISEADGLGPMK